MDPENELNAIAKYSAKEKRHNVRFPTIFSSQSFDVKNIPSKVSFSMEVGMLPLKSLRLSSRNAIIV